MIACVAGLIIPIAGFVALLSVNQRLPSGPAAIRPGTFPVFRPLLNSVIASVVGLIIPIAWFPR